jgi:hypothetical protein
MNRKPPAGALTAAACMHACLRSRKTLIYLILTLNHCYPDYDFSLLRAHHFRKEPGVGAVEEAVDSHLLEVSRVRRRRAPGAVYRSSSCSWGVQAICRVCSTSARTCSRFLGCALSCSRHAAFCCMPADQQVLSCGPCGCLRGLLLQAGVPNLLRCECSIAGGITSPESHCLQATSNHVADGFLAVLQLERAG